MTPRPEKISLAVAPLNLASQGTAWRTAARTHLEVNASAFAFDGPGIHALRRATRISDKSDASIPHYRLSTSRTRRRWLSSRLAHVTHLINESNMPIYKNPESRRFTDEVGYYLGRGIQSSIVFHGSDARDPGLALAINPESYYRDADPSWVKKLGERASWNRSSAQDSGIPIFVTTLDMLDHVAGAQLLPITIQVENWALHEKPFERKTLRVLHVPSSTVTKGSRYIMPVLEDFERSGRIEIVRSDRVAHSEIKALYASTDIVVDSIQVGSYGVTALEAMAGGRLTIAHVGKAARARMEGDLPIVEATPATFRSVLEQTIEERERSATIARSGPSYVRHWHDGRAAAAVLAHFLEVQN